MPHLTPRQLAERWAISERSALRMAESGKLRALRVGRLWRFPLDAVAAYEAEHTAASHQAAQETASTTTVAPRARRSDQAPAVALEGGYAPVFRGPVPWRPEVIEATAPARRRVQGSKKAGSVRG